MNLKELMDQVLEEKKEKEEKKTGTFKCPNCGTKVPFLSKFCLKCQKKVEPGKAEGDEN